MKMYAQPCRPMSRFIRSTESISRYRPISTDIEVHKISTPERRRGHRDPAEAAGVSAAGPVDAVVLLARLPQSKLESIR
jgi:hypothetical protein